MYEQKVHQLQSQLATSRMMEKELSVDLEALQDKYDKDQAAAALQIKALHDKYSLTVKELSEMVGGKE
jgi:iron only hydrogenase large subunit-like protein